MASRKEDIKRARTTRLNWLIVMGMLVFLTLLALPSTQYYDLEDLEIGEASPVTYRADREYRVRDHQRRENELHRRLSRIKPLFVEDRRSHREIIRDLEARIQKLRAGETQIQDVTTPQTPQQWTRLEEITKRITEFLLERGVIRDKNVFSEFEYQTHAQLQIHRPGEDRDATRRELALSDLESRLISLEQIDVYARNTLRNFYRDFPHKDLVLDLVQETIRPTVLFRAQHFQEQKEAIQREVGPYTVTVEKGEMLIRSGEVVSRRHLQILRQINQRKVRLRLSGGFASLGVSLLGAVFIFLYLREFQPNFLDRSNRLGLVVILVIILSLIAKGIEFLQPALPPGIEYVVPFAGPIMLVALMLSSELALLLCIFLALLTVTFFNFTFELFVLFLLGGLAGIFSVKDVERRFLLVRSGIVVGLVQLLAVALFYTLRTGTILTPELGFRLVWSGVNGVVVVPVFVVGLLPFLESGFQINTHFRLLELADLNHPLLRDLFERAPGTYQHSIMLSNLCERAAQAIGANALLVRVGAYYHDLGKAEIAEYFIENQSQGSNPHDDLKPTLSASILKSHVKKGAARAREAGLPEEIVDLIEQHHGTSLIQYFYHRALEQENEEVTKEEFKYPGPRPQTREAGICMLGDAVEAASRTLDDPSPKKIRELVTDLVYEKFEQGQLNECDLTLKDLNTIVETFTRVLGSVFHHRIEYPDEEDVERLEDRASGRTSADDEEQVLVMPGGTEDEESEDDEDSRS